MNAYSKIYDYLSSVTNRRGTILKASDGEWFINGGWYLNGSHSMFTGAPNALKTLIAKRLPVGTEVEIMWLWLNKGKMKFGYRAVGCYPITIDLLPCHFEEDFS